MERIPGIWREGSYFAADMIKMKTNMKRMKLFGCMPLLAGLAVCAGCGDTSKDVVGIMEPVKVKTMKVELSEMNESRQFSGTVEEENGSALSFSVMGTLKNIYVGLGSRVKKGQLIAEVDQTSMESSYRAAKASMEQAEDAFQRMKELHDKGSLPEIKWVEVQSKLEQARSMEQIAAKSLRDSKLYAPYAGMVAEKNVEVGQNVMPGVPVVRLVSTSGLKVKIAVPESEITAVAVGRKATVSVPALGDRTFAAVVTEKGVVAHSLSRSYEVKLRIEGSEHGLMPGMVADVTLAPSAADEAAACVVPARIVQIDEHNATFVWTVVHGKAHKTVVDCGEYGTAGVTVIRGRH